MTINLEAMGARIRAARTSAKLTQEALAQMVGTTASTIGRIERGDSDPRAGMLLLISGELGVWPEFLLAGRKPSFNVTVTVEQALSDGEVDLLLSDMSGLVNGLKMEK